MSDNLKPCPVENDVLHVLGLWHSCKTCPNRSPDPLVGELVASLEECESLISRAYVWLDMNYDETDGVQDRMLSVLVKAKALAKVKQ